MEIKYDKVLGEVREADTPDLSGYLTLDQSTPQTITGLADGYLNLSGGVITSTTLNISDWNTAYGWGNHADAGYAKLDCTNQPFTGNISFSSTADRTISVATSSSIGKYLAISSGNGATGGYSGGVISLIGGIGGNNLAEGNQGGNGGNSYLIGGKGGNGYTAGIGGNAYITGGASGDSSDGGARAGAVVITGGAVSTSSDENGDGGSVSITGGSATGQISGSVNINAGSGGTSGTINIGTTRGIIYLGQDIYLNGDSRKLYFGAGNDASITYDGTNLIINSRAVGTGATIFSAGKVVVGKDIFPVATNLAVGVDGANAIGGWSSAGTSVSPIFFMARARGTHASPTAIQSADFLGEVGFFGQFNSTIGSVGAGATIRGIAMGTFSATSYPTDLLFFTTASGSTALTENMRLTSTGRLGIGTTTPTKKLDIVGTGNNQFRLSSTETDATSKFAYINGRHYTNAEEDLLLFLGGSTSTENYAAYGGGSGSANAATRLSFYTGATTTTLTGTERMRIDSAGNVGIGRTAPVHQLDVSRTTTDHTAITAAIRGSMVKTIGSNDGNQSAAIIAESTWGGAANYTTHSASIYGTNYFNGTGNMVSQNGLWFIVGTTGDNTGSVSTRNGIKITQYSTSSKAVTESNGIYISNMAAYNSPITTAGLNIAASENAVGTTKYGILIGNQSGATTNYALYAGNGISKFTDTVKIAADSKKLHFGAGDDAYIQHTGTNWEFSPEVATSQIVFNEGGMDTDFRIEGDTDPNLFYADAGNGRIGIGTSAPTEKLDVNGNINATAYKVGTVAGASGTFTTADSKTVTVTNGIITSIV